MGAKKRIILYYQTSLDLSKYKNYIEIHSVELQPIQAVEDFHFAKNILGLFLIEYDFFLKPENKEIFEKEAFSACILLIVKPGQILDEIDDDLVIQYLESINDDQLFYKAVENGFKRLGYSKKVNSLERKLIIREGELQELQAIGVALSTEKDIHTLLKIILRFAVDITGSDAGSLYLVLKEEKNKKMLHFALNYNYSINAKTEAFKIPLDNTSLAGYVAITNKTLNIKDSYHLPEELDCVHSRDFDLKYNYKTRSILTFPMQNRKDEVIGVIQLINKKNRMDKILKTKEDFDEYVISYSETDEQMVSSLASQAAVALENAILYDSIQKLFEGFVKASVSAIESRDPTTSGHSDRVAVYSTQLAMALCESSNIKYNQITFSEDEIKELKYAALLHDFGKVGVRENVLTKAKKLYPEELNNFYSRIYYIKRDITATSLLKKVDVISKVPKTDFSEDFKTIDEALEKELHLLDFYLSKILIINEPYPISEEDKKILLQIKEYQYFDPSGAPQKLLTEKEYRKLAIPAGSLDESERKDIESHVTHSYEFLKRIPWTMEMQRIPEIAYGHHEKLNGKGYPRGLKSDEITIQSRIIAIADIYDALTASDRPYKKAMPAEKAIEILRHEASVNNLDKDLVEIFIERKIYSISLHKEI